MGIYWSGPAVEGSTRVAPMPGASPEIRARPYGSRRSRRNEIISLLSSADPAISFVQRVCELAAEILGVSGAAMCLVGGARRQVVVHATDRLAEDLVDLQVSLGEGPCIQAVRTGSPVVVARLQEKHLITWASYADQALARGVRALFTFPLRADSVRLGALDLYRLAPGGLSPRQAADAHVLCDIANRSMVVQPDRPQIDGTAAGLLRSTLNSRRATPGRSGVLDVETTVAQALHPSRRRHRPRVLESVGR